MGEANLDSREEIMDMLERYHQEVWAEKSTKQEVLSRKLQ